MSAFPMSSASRTNNRGRTGVGFDRKESEYAGIPAYILLLYELLPDEAGTVGTKMMPTEGAVWLAGPLAAG